MTPQRSTALAGLLLLAQACANHPAAWSPAARATPASCDAPGASAAHPWRLVTAPGFTFCIPEDWTAIDEHTWGGAAGTVRWGTGAPPARLAVPDAGTAPIPQIPAGAEQRWPITVPPPDVVPRCSIYLAEERPGGHLARLRDTDCDGRHYTEGRWPDAALFFEGEAAGAAAASSQLAVFRTVRVVDAPVRVELTPDRTSYFEGEPIYVLVRIRNTAGVGVPVPPHPGGCASTAVTDSSGRDMTRERVWIDVLGIPAPVLLPPDSSIYWVMPVHWFWGSARESEAVAPFYGFRPGTYRMTMTFEECHAYGSARLSVARGALTFRVNVRSDAESAARRRALAAAGDLVGSTKAEGSPVAALPRLVESLREPDLAAYRAFLALDVASVLRAFGRTYSGTYAQALDSVWIAYLGEFTSPTPVAVRILEALDSAAVAGLDTTRVAPALRPYVVRRLRGAR